MQHEAEKTDVREQRSTKRPHRRTRNGCLNCKRRKVKCDEQKPQCANCIRFCIPCDLTSAACPASGSPPVFPSHVADSPESPVVHRRGRGRPRKDWSFAATPRASMSASEQSLSPIPGVSTPESPVVETAYPSCSINVSDAELLLHFTMHTARSLGDTPTDPWGEAWARNAMQVGLAHPFVLHLAMGLAGHHLAYLNSENQDRKAHYTSVAGAHVSAGLAEVARALTTCDESSCGAIYLASLLVSYCSYAAGPSSSNDLFVCDVGYEKSQQRPPLITGTRLLRESYQYKTLFSGLMAPFGPASHFPIDTRPTYLCHGFQRIEWVRPFEELRELVSSQDSPRFAVYDKAIDGLEVIYDATYGRSDEVYDGEQANKIIFGWMYRMDDKFQACLQRREPVALLILAHFAILLRTKPFWFLRGWEQHLLDRIAELTGGRFAAWLPWTVQAQHHDGQC